MNYFPIPQQFQGFTPQMPQGGQLPPAGGPMGGYSQMTDPQPQMPVGGQYQNGVPSPGTTGLAGLANNPQVMQALAAFGAKINAQGQQGQQSAPAPQAGITTPQQRPFVWNTPQLPRANTNLPFVGGSQL